MAKNTKKNKGDEQLDQAAVFLEYFFKSCISGLRKTVSNKLLLVFFIVVTATSALVSMRNEEILYALGMSQTPGVIPIALKFAWLLPLLFLFVAGSTENSDADKYRAQFESIRFANRAGEYPQLVKKRNEGKKEILTFRSKGIGISEWRENWTGLESALDCNILRISIDPQTKTLVHLETVPSALSIGTDIPWRQNYVSDKDFVLVAGQGLLEPVELNLDKYPHALVGGATGSGKSVVLRTLLWQCIVKGAMPYMIDFKGGIELSAFESFGEMVYERPQALELLKDLTREMKLRLDLFRSVGVKNLTEYNMLNPDEPLARIVLACDEVSEMLDKTGLSGSDAKIFKEIEGEMSKIARLGRAPGINMLLGTQRPDANVISGQIRNNLTIKIAGRVTDEYASKMILGNAKAAALGDILGRFLYTVGADTFEFQGYNFKDKDIIPGDYRIGSLLIDRLDSENDEHGDEYLEDEFDSHAEGERSKSKGDVNDFYDIDSL